MSEEQTKATRVAAIYARVSSARQRQEQTIQSQIAGLRELAAGRGLLVAEISSSRMRASPARR